MNPTHEIEELIAACRVFRDRIDALERQVAMLEDITKTQTELTEAQNKLILELQLQSVRYESLR